MAEQTTVERVAKAAEAKAFEGYTIDPIDLDWIAIVRAAIEAIEADHIIVPQKTPG